MRKKEKKSSGGLGLFSILLIIFVVLKLCHLIDWAWVWVLAPLWIGAIFYTILALVMILVATHRRKKIREDLEMREFLRKYADKGKDAE